MELPGLVDLLCSNSRTLASHTREKAATDSYYLASWALAHSGADRELLGTPELDAYIARWTQRGSGRGL